MLTSISRDYLEQPEAHHNLEKSETMFRIIELGIKPGRSRSGNHVFTGSLIA